jgi:hypothetical protein
LIGNIPQLVILKRIAYTVERENFFIHQKIQKREDGY